jgi:stress-induced morphogen
MDPQLIKDQLMQHFPDATIKLKDLTGGGDHWSLEISSAAFNGKSLVQQHQLVYRALQHWINKEIHALALSTIPLS